VSDTLNWRRLYWLDNRGRAVVNGHGTELDAAPVIGGATVIELDYLPSLGLGRIRREPWQAMEDMNEAERADAEAILDRSEAGRRHA
jgi:hypothetical protein